MNFDGEKMFYYEFHSHTNAASLSSIVEPESMWDLPGPGIKLMTPALAGGFFITAPPRKPQ